MGCAGLWRSRDTSEKTRRGKKVPGNAMLTGESESWQRPQAGSWRGLNHVTSPRLASASPFSPPP